MTFDECVQSIRKGSVISFKEYTLDRHERKRLSLNIEGAIVQEVFPANETLSRDVLEQYYGTELEEQDYLQLSCMNCPRFVVSLGVSEENVMNIKILILNRDFYNMGHQEITVTNELSPENIAYEPNYVAMAQQGGWM